MERQRLEHEVRTRIRDIMEHMEGIRAGVPKGQRAYIDMHGTEHLECIGAYDSEMTRAMARDMFLSHVAIGGRMPDLAGQAKDWMLETAELDDALMRSFDDYQAGRSLIPWDGGRTMELIGQMAHAVDEASKALKVAGDGSLERFMLMCGEWSRRLVYMDSHAARLEVMDDVDMAAFRGPLDMDGDGHARRGQAPILEPICRIRKSLADLLVCVPVDGDEHTEVLRTLELFGGLAAAVSGSPCIGHS